MPAKINVRVFRVLRGSLFAMKSVPPAVAGGSPQNPPATAGGTDLIITILK